MIIKEVFTFNYTHIEDIILEFADEIQKGYKNIKFNQLPFQEMWFTSYKPCLEVVLHNKERENI